MINQEAAGVEKLARIISVHPSTIHRWIREGKFIPHHYTLPSGRRMWRVSDVKSWLANRDRV